MHSERRDKRIKHCVFGLGLIADSYRCSITYRGTLCWWEDLLEKRATKEKQSVNNKFMTPFTVAKY